MQIAAMVDRCTVEPSGHDLTNRLQDIQPGAPQRITRRGSLNAFIAGQDQLSRAPWAPSRGAAR